MNSSETNQTTISFTKWDYLESLGFSWQIDCYHLLFQTPVSFIGIVLNQACFIIFSNVKFNKIPLYHYLRVLILNSVFISLLEFLIFFSHTYRFFEFSNSYITSFYTSYIYTPFYNFSILLGSFLNLLISIERISLFKNKLGVLLKLSPNINCLIMVFVSALISVQYFFVFHPYTIEVKLDSVTTYRINTWRVTEFIQSKLGVAISISINIFKDVFLLLFEAIVNISTIVYLKNYLKNRNKLQTSLDPRKIAKRNKRIGEPEQKATLMVIIMSVFSSIQHLLLLTTVVIFNFYSGQTALMFGFFSNAFVSFKNVMNVFLFYFFNKNFRSELKKIFNSSKK